MFTFILPALLRPSTEQLPELAVPALNELMRLGEFRFEKLSLTELYARYLCGSFTLPEKNSVYASPLSQQVGMHSVNLADGQTIGITAEEATTLCNGLNEFFRDCARFTVLRPDLWTVQLSMPSLWHAPPVFDVLGQIDGSIRAEGEDAGQWLQLQTEIQMWLHGHPMNRHRIQQGKAAINGIWLWNAPDEKRGVSPTALIGSDSPWVQQSPLAVQPAPHNFAQWQQLCHDRQLNIAETSLFLDDLMASACTGDVWDYRQIVQQWDERFFAPVCQALKKGSLKGVRLITDGLNGGTLTVKPPTFWSFLAGKRHFSGKNL